MRKLISVMLVLCSGRLAAQAPTPQTIQGLGTITFPTSTKSPAAQTAFIRGVLLLHIFEYPDAAASFREAQKLDSGFAMAYWGEAMTYTHPVWNEQNFAGARAVLLRLGSTPAERRTKAGTKREAMYLAAVETLYGDGSKPKRDTLYSSAMHQLLLAYPDDDEARAFYALSLLGLSQGVRNVPTYLAAGELAESVFARNHKHPGAAHYWIHSMDDPEHAPDALAAALALSVIAPDAGHSQHMTTHIFLAMGMWNEVVSQNEVALRVVDSIRKSRGRPPAACGHYPSWLAYGYGMQGRLVASQKAVQACRTDAMADADNSSRASFVSMWSRYVLDAAQWNSDVDALVDRSGQRSGDDHGVPVHPRVRSSTARRHRRGPHGARGVRQRCGSLRCCAGARERIRSRDARTPEGCARDAPSAPGAHRGQERHARFRDRAHSPCRRGRGQYRCGVRAALHQ